MHLDTNETRSLNRRNFLKTSGLALSAAGLAAANAAQAAPWLSLGRNLIAKNDLILFQGDSITDAGRSRDKEKTTTPNNQPGMGSGYAWLAAVDLLVDRTGDGLKIFNRGISGHKVFQLAERWQSDCLDLKPNVLSILIGVNDIWHKLNGNFAGTVESYEQGFAALLKRTKDALPDVKLVICEPFVLKCGAVNEKWFPEFDERRAAAKRVADDAGAAWAPFQTMFDEAVAAGTKPNYWAGDGVHPSMAGHSLMAQQWRKSAGI